MPRDLFTSDTKDDSLVASPRPSTPTPDRTEVATATGNDGYREFTIHRDESTGPSVRQLRGSQVNADEKDNLHPYVQTLSQSDLESCVALENAVFPEEERCSREKVDTFPYNTLVRILRSRSCQKKSPLFISPSTIYYCNTLMDRITTLTFMPLLTIKSFISNHFVFPV